VNNNNIVAYKCKNCIISTNIDSCRNIGHKLGDFVLNVTGLQVRIFFFWWFDVYKFEYFLRDWCFKTQVTRAQNNWADISNLPWMSCQFD